MAHVLLTSSADLAPENRPYAFDELQRMQASAQYDTFGVHQVTDDPARADIILFVENIGTTTHYFREVRHHPFYRSYPEKCSARSGSTPRHVPYSNAPVRSCPRN
jgi:hypothetical protein